MAARAETAARAERRTEGRKRMGPGRVGGESSQEASIVRAQQRASHGGDRWGRRGGGRGSWRERELFLGKAEGAGRRGEKARREATGRRGEEAE